MDHQSLLPWSEKYRPKCLEDLSSVGSIIQTLKLSVETSSLPHLLFYGPPGTGKTTAILAISNVLYAPKEKASMILEMNASDDRGIDIVRNEILNFASSRTLLESKPKLVILDEADSMTSDAQNALRRIIEKYTINVRFCLLCNYLTGIIPAIQSRCTRFRFPPLPHLVMIDRLNYICDCENVEKTSDGIDSLAIISKGDMRKAINILQSTAMSFKNVNRENVEQCTGHPSRSEIENISNLLLNSSIDESYERLLTLTVTKGVAIPDLLNELVCSLNNSDIPSIKLCKLINSISQIEYNSASSSNQKIHLAALAGAFRVVNLEN